ncbi:hypothetical protein CY658_23720 [Variovorax sp. RO1]|nr:hypothetical protein CY658_23720 [Variovorax sp. RO1]
MREHLKELGFSPSNRNVIGDFEPPLYMVWRRDLVGRQYPVLSRSSDAGRVIESWCCSSVNYIEITEDDQAKLARNSRINFVLAPLHEIRDAIQDLLRVPFLLILWLMGFRSGA